MVILVILNILCSISKILSTLHSTFIGKIKSDDLSDAQLFILSRLKIVFFNLGFFSVKLAFLFLKQNLEENERFPEPFKIIISLLCSRGRENFVYEDDVYFSDTKYLVPSSCGAVFLVYPSKQSVFLGRDWHVSKISGNKCRTDISFFKYQKLNKIKSNPSLE